jgi:hypothetical protein
MNKIYSTSTRKLSASSVYVVAIILLIISGVTYRVLASLLKNTIETPIKLPVPLSAFPVQIGNWTGKDVPIPENIQRVSQNDDFISRLYVNESTNLFAHLYVAYSARPREMLWHKPEVCYVGSGWVLDSTTKSDIFSISGRKIPCVFYRFHIPTVYEEKIVLNFYVLNGQLNNDESVFSEIGWRTPNIEGNATRYVAKIQISSVLENSVEAAARDTADLIVDFFADNKGIL